MPNYCDYEMRVVGKKENVEEFTKVMTANYDYYKMEFSYDRHMGGRVFEANTWAFEKMDNDVWAAMIDGYCAWSVHSCMFDGGHTYYNDLKSIYKEKCRSTTIPIEAERLDLGVEVFSKECGMGFQEHYIVRKGEITTDECVDYIEYYVEEYNTKEEAEKELEIEISDEEWESGECSIVRGGFDKWEFEI